MVETLRGLVAQWRERAANRTAPYPASQSPGYGRGTRMLSGDLLQCADELAAVLAARPSASGWQPIGSAPKDNIEGVTCGSLVLVYGERVGYGLLYGFVARESNYTHWMPIPASPWAPSGEEKERC